MKYKNMYNFRFHYSGLSAWGRCDLLGADWQLVRLVDVFGDAEHRLVRQSDAEEEADTRPGLIDGRDRLAASRQFQTEQAQIVSRRFVGRAVNERGELLDAVDIGDLGRGRETAQGHVTDQALTKTAVGWGLGYEDSLLQKIGRRVIARPEVGKYQRHVARMTKSLRSLYLAFFVCSLSGCGPADKLEPSQRGGAANHPLQRYNLESPGVAHDPWRGEISRDRVFFAYDSSNLELGEQATLDTWVRILKERPDFKIMIEGHCDERGTREYNLALGERRAEAVRRYLTAHGIRAARLKTVSYGKERPLALGNNEAAWILNRTAVGVME